MKRISLLLMIGLVGCETSSGILKMGPDAYAVSIQNDSGFVVTTTLHRKAVNQANNYCKDMNKEMMTVSTSAGNFYYEINFMCLHKDDPALHRPYLVPVD